MPVYPLDLHQRQTILEQILLRTHKPSGELLYIRDAEQAHP